MFVLTTLDPRPAIHYAGLMSIRVIVLGDIVGTPGIRAIEQLMPELRIRYKPDLVIANAENASEGSGLTPIIFKQLRNAGVDGITLGDHCFKRMQIAPTLESESVIIRPANLPLAAKGRRWMALTPAGAANRPKVYVATVLGRVFATLPADDPFVCIETILGQLPEVNPIVIIEVHAEATSEKQAIGWYMDGRAALVFGTHTHVPTADARILPSGTAYITDLGMTGPYESVIGRRIDRVLSQMTTAMPTPFDVATADVRVCGVLVDIDERSRKATHVERVEMQADLLAPPFV